MLELARTVLELLGSDVNIELRPLPADDPRQRKPDIRRAEFALVAANPLPKLPTLIVIGVAAVIQVLVHLRYFLHLALTSTPRENLLAIVFTAILIFLMVGGSFWIMLDLNHRMSM